MSAVGDPASPAGQEPARGSAPTSGAVRGRRRAGRPINEAPVAEPGPAVVETGAADGAAVFAVQEVLAARRAGSGASPESVGGSAARARVMSARAQVRQAMALVIAATPVAAPEASRAIATITCVVSDASRACATARASHRTVPAPGPPRPSTAATAAHPDAGATP
ncbi:DUF6207 family protein [Streptomyces sp. NPDC050535]|uniref:DUF6207 family protein n=1 Tax=Streptomyces sp. NPDC050535 TaxID=3365626 RepID=UPI00378EDB02